MEIAHVEIPTSNSLFQQDICRSVVGGQYGSCNRMGSPDLINIGGATVLSSMVSLDVEGLARSMRHNKSGGELAS
jgi:hypothetical protein